MAKAKNINVYKLFSKTYNDRPMFSFVGFGELGLMPKVKKPIKQVSNVWNECECNNIGFINNEWLCLECGEKIEQKEDNE